VRVDAIVVLVVAVYRRYKANWYRDISQRLPPLSADCALAVVYLWPGYYRRPATQDLGMGVPRVSQPLRRSVMLSRQEDPRLLLRFQRGTARFGTRGKSRLAPCVSPSSFSRFARGWLDTRDNEDATFIATARPAPPKTRPRSTFRALGDFTRAPKKPV